MFWVVLNSLARLAIRFSSSGVNNIRPLTYCAAAKPNLAVLGFWLLCLSANRAATGLVALIVISLTAIYAVMPPLACLVITRLAAAFNSACSALSKLFVTNKAGQYMANWRFWRADKFPNGPFPVKPLCALTRAVFAPMTGIVHSTANGAFRFSHNHHLHG